MIYDYPYHRNYYNIYRKNNYLNNNFKSNNTTNNLIDDNTLNNTENFINNTEENRASSDDAIIEIFGIKFAFDDLIILGLLYLLYMEDVKDISLYLVLILLLLN